MMQQQKKYEYLPNAYWEKEDRSQLKCIRMTTQADGKKLKEILVYDKILPNGFPNPDYSEVISLFGIEAIDRNTDERKIKKEKEEREKQAVDEQKRKSRELEQLFNLKLQAFEIEEVKNGSDRDIRAKIRRAKNVVELNALTAIAIGVELGYIPKKEAVNE
jgi:hypothetical protein